MSWSFYLRIPGRGLANLRRELEVIHPATTSPRAAIDFYLDEHEQSRGAIIREQLAAYAHEVWSRWMKYLFTKTLSWQSDLPSEDGGIDGAIIPEPFVERWQRQLSTPYAELPENEKESDRAEADKILTIIRDPK